MSEDGQFLKRVWPYATKAFLNNWSFKHPIPKTKVIMLWKNPSMQLSYQIKAFYLCKPVEKSQKWTYFWIPQKFFCNNRNFLKKQQ